MRLHPLVTKIAIVLALVIAASVAAFAIFQPIKVLPRIHSLPAFDLVDQDGNYFGVPEFLGSLTLVSFFTASDPVALQWLERLAELQEQIDADPEAVDVPLQIVAISLDPKNDTQEVLSGLARRLGLDQQRWSFLTGSELALKLAVGTGFGVFYTDSVDDNNGGSGIVYDRTLILVDERGFVRARYTADEKGVARVPSDVEMLREEARSSGAGRVVYEAAHLFLCYPR